MCFSQTTSKVSYSLGMLAAIIAFATKQYILGTLILFFSQMQLSELLIWKGIDENNTNINQKGTAYGKYTLPMHPFAIGLGILLSIYMVKGSVTIKDAIPAIIGILFYFIIVYYVYQNKESKETYPLVMCKTEDKCQNSKNRLIWPYETSWYMYSFVLCLLFLLFMYPSFAMGNQLLSCLFFILSFATVVYMFDSRVVSSLWCFSAALFAPALVLLNYYFYKN